MKNLLIFFLLSVFLVGCTTSQVSNNVSLGMSALENSQYSLAIQEFKKAIVDSPKNYEGYLQAGKLLFLKGEVEEAKNILELGIQNSENKTWLEKELSVILLTLKEFDQSLEYAKSAYYSTDHNNELFSQYLTSLAFAGKSNEYEEELKKANNSLLNKGLLLTKAIVLKDEEGKKAFNNLEVSKELQEIYSTYTESSDLFAKTQLLYEVINEGLLGVSYYPVTEIINNNEFYETAFIYRGIINLNYGLLNEALKDFEKAKLLLPDKSNTDFYILRTVLEKNDAELFLTKLNLVNLNNISEEELTILAKRMLDLQDLDSLSALLEKVTTPWNDQNYFQLSLKLQTENFENLSQDLTNFNENGFSKDIIAEATALKAYALVLNEENDSSNELFASAISLDGSNAWINLYLAKSYIEESNLEEAKIVLEKAIDFDLYGGVSKRAQLLLDSLNP